ncbi:MAG: hypothetical protein WEG40_03245 [Candidatus Rokuibacteriota bacterium]
MSNITIGERESELAALPPDLLLTSLDRYTADGVFQGAYTGPGRGNIEESFERNLARIYEGADTPRLSGIQMKAPMYLDTNGTLDLDHPPVLDDVLTVAPCSFEHSPKVEFDKAPAARFST